MEQLWEIAIRITRLFLYREEFWFMQTTKESLK